MYLYAVPHDIGKCAFVGEERKSPVRDESQEHPSSALTVPQAAAAPLQTLPHGACQFLPSHLCPLHYVPSPSPSPLNKGRHAIEVGD